jgi:molybdenum cofactor sulfurtransferase
MLKTTTASLHKNASGGLKIVGECYPFDENAHYLLLSDNHNSVNGIREYCTNRGGQFNYAKLRHEDLLIDQEELLKDLSAHNDKENKLFAFPAQSNVSGVKHDLSWVKKAQDKGWDVLLDAAAYVPTIKLDLKEIQAEFVTVSFYKIFGYPTGIGCLFVKKSAFPKLKKRWFAGGTVNLASVRSPHFFLADNYERFENGTIDYLGIPALKIGLDHIEYIGMKRLNERVKGLMDYLIPRIENIQHDSGVNVIKTFGPSDRNLAGGTLIMSFFNPDGSLVPFEKVEYAANARKISIRSGCFCNPGIDEINSCISTDELANYFTSREKGNYKEMVEELNKMRGATRLSVGIPTTKSDLDTFISFLSSLRNTEFK